MAETCSKMCCGENNQNLIAEYKLHLCFPLQLLSASVDLSVSVVTSAGEERLGVAHGMYMPGM